MSHYDTLKIKQGYCSSNCGDFSNNLYNNDPVGLSGSYSVSNDSHLPKDYSKLKGGYEHNK